jgi:TPR repeat protein
MSISGPIRNVDYYQKGIPMKLLLSLALLCFLAGSAFAQTPPVKHHHRNTNAPAGSPDGGGNPAYPTPAPESPAEQTKQVEFYQKSFVPNDPWRIINSATNFAKGADWVQFEGRVTQVSADGLVIQGWFGEPLFYMLPNNGGATTASFLLSNYPRNVGVGQTFSRNDRLVAMKSGDKNGMPSLDYGAVYVPELTDEQKAAAAQAKSKAADKVLAFHKELADKGDAYGQFKMGMRYLTGDGVDKDMAKARDLLGKAAAQGNKDAATELAKLPAN